MVDLGRGIGALPDHTGPRRLLALASERRQRRGASTQPGHGLQVVVPIAKGRTDLGPWQRVFYGEWDGRRLKRLLTKIIGE